MAKKEGAAAKDAFFNRPAKFKAQIPERKTDDDGFTIIGSPKRKRVATPPKMRALADGAKKLGRLPKFALIYDPA